MEKTYHPEILLIEKDEITLELYQRELSKSFSVVALADLDQVMDILCAQDIRAVIIEPEICAGQGWELIEAIRAAFPGRILPVIVCSTRDESSDRRGKGVASYLTKPVLPRALREKVIEIVNPHPSLSRRAP